MTQHMFTFRYVDVLPMLSFAVVFLWLRLNGVNLRKLALQGALTVTGHLRRRPDPAMEQALRAAFTNLDKELAEILGDRTPYGKFD